MYSQPPPPPPPPPPAAPPPLPPGWNEHRDAHGRVYYHNVHSNETTWQHPGGPAVAPPASTSVPSTHYSTADPARRPHDGQHSYGYPSGRDMNLTRSMPGDYPDLPSATAPPLPPPESSQYSTHHYSGAPPHAPYAQASYPTSSYPSSPNPPPNYSAGSSAPPYHAQSQFSSPHENQLGSAASRGPASFVNTSTSQLSNPGDEVQLELSAENLRSKDKFGKSDPMVVVYMHQNLTPHRQEWIEVGRTEKIMNDHNPRWQTRIKVRYCFYERQSIRFAVFDVDSAGGKVNSDDHLGMADTDLGHIMAANTWREGLRKLKFNKGVPIGGSGIKDRGDIVVKVHNASVEGQSKIYLRMVAKGLDKKDGFGGKSDPYFNIHQQVGYGGYTKVYTSETIMNNCNPAWKDAEFSINTQGRAPHDVNMRIDCYDWDRNTPHDLIGSVDITLAHLSAGAEFGLINEKKRRKKGRRYTDSGKLKVANYRLVHIPSFNAYLGIGLKIHLTVGIDFTASNGHPGQRDSLHFVGDNGAPNQYIQALESVGGILGGYTKDGMIAAYGFGAKVPPDMTVGFNFPLSTSGAYCHGVEGLIDAYKHRISTVQFSGPTNFTPLIRTARDIASRDPLSARNLSYHCLLIITDGAITDMRETVDIIIECSYSTPLSIIIIGVGNADFGKMRRLDADEHALTSDDGRRKAKRDIAQFVPYREYGNDPFKERLRKDVLAELPSRIVETLVDAGITP